MAGVGFELKKLFHKAGIVNRIKAYTYSSLVTVGPMIFCMLMILGIQLMMTNFGVDYAMRQLFLGGVIYSFIFSYLLISLFNMLLTRNLADMIFLKEYSRILPSLSYVLSFVLPITAIPWFLFLLLIEINWGLKLAFYIFYMELVLIWTLSVYISAIKEYLLITIAFVVGILFSFLGVYLLLHNTPFMDVTGIMFVLDTGLFITVILLWFRITRTFYTPPTIRNYAFKRSFWRYPSLVGIGFIGALGLFSHQFIQWFGPYGVWIENSFFMSPRYDVAVFYAFLSVIPTLIFFVVNLETEFYQKYKKYYDMVLGKGSILDINESRNEMVRVLIREISLIMGVQLFFSIMFIAVGIRLLPMIGFTVTQIDTYNILVMGFYAYIMYHVVSVVLLYFDDRKGVLWLAILFLFLCSTSTFFLLAFENQGLSLFMAAFLTLIAAFARLVYILRNLHYYTFCAQPIFVNKGNRANERKE